jgi:hypothetical protein
VHAAFDAFRLVLILRPTPDAMPMQLVDQYERRPSARLTLTQPGLAPFVVQPRLTKEVTNELPPRAVEDGHRLQGDSLPVVPW